MTQSSLLKTRALAERLQILQPCTCCNANPLEHCVSKTGNRTGFHAARWRMALNEARKWRNDAEAIVSADFGKYGEIATLLADHDGYPPRCKCGWSAGLVLNDRESARLQLRHHQEDMIRAHFGVNNDG